MSLQRRIMADDESIELGIPRAPLRYSADHRLTFRLADIPPEFLAQLLGEPLVSDKAAKVIGKLILEYRLEA